MKLETEQEVIEFLKIIESKLEGFPITQKKATELINKIEMENK